MSKIEATETVVYGISTDDQESHNQFSQTEGFGFILLADVDHIVSQQYSGLRDQSLSNRVTFVIDRAGYIRIIDKEVDVRNHGSDLVQMIKNTTQYQIKAGQPAPDFIAYDQDGKVHQISNLKGKKNIVLAFYPMDMTPG